MFKKSTPIAVTKPVMDERIGNSWSIMFFIILLILFIALRLWNITAFSLWGGEAFSMIGVQQSWNSMFAYLLADIVHPPLFYVLLKLWIEVGGNSLLWLKLFPVITSIGVVIPFMLFCRNLNLQLPVVNFALLLVAINGFLIHYSQELRMYSLFTFLAMTSFWLFIRFFKTPGQATGQLLLLTFINLLAIYTHYYGWVVVGMEFLFLLIYQRKRVLTFGLSILILSLCFAPWAFMVTQEAQAIGGLEKNLDWIPKPRITDLLNLYVTFNGPFGSRFIKILGLLLFGLPLVLWIWSYLRIGFRFVDENLIQISYLSILAFLPALILFLISQRLPQAVWIDRYFIFIAIPYLLLVAVAVYQLKPSWVRNIFIVAIALWSMLAGVNDLISNRMAWEGPQLGSRVEWKDLVQQMVAVEKGSKVSVNVYTLPVISKGLLTGDWALSTSLKFYLDSIGDDRFQMVYSRSIHALIDENDESYFWIAYFELAESNEPSPIEFLIQNGYSLGNEISYQERNNRIVLLPVWRN